MQLTKIFDLAYAFNGDSIELEQDAGCGEVDRITMHRIHVRLFAEQLGILPPSDLEAARTVARLGRQLRTLHARINELDDMVREKAGFGREDLDAECIFSLATWELATEFVNDLPGGEALGALPERNDPVSGGVDAGNPPSSGAVPIDNPPKKGAIRPDGQMPLAPEGGKA